MIEKTPSSTEINIDTRRQIALASEDYARCMAIRDADWKRIKRSLSKISEPPRWLSISYSILFGIAATAALSIIPIMGSKELPSWVSPLYWITSFFSAAVAIILVFVDRSARSGRETDVRNIKEDMDEIEAFFNREKESGRQWVEWSNYPNLRRELDLQAEEEAKRRRKS